MIHVLWLIYVRVVAPPLLIGMGVYAIRRLRRDYRTMGWFDRLVFTFNALAMVPLGLLALAAAIWVTV